MNVIDSPPVSYNNSGMAKTYLTVKEVIERTGWTRQWVNSLLKRGKLKGVQQKNGRWLIEEQSFLEYDPDADKGGGRR